MKGIGWLAAVALITCSPASSAADRYAAGQVWAYKTRPGDSGSLLRIGQVQNDSKLGTIYHISVIGFKFRNARMHPILPHLPVSAATLDQSVTRLSRSTAAFPDVKEGVAEWERARGGVYTISVAEIVGIIDAQTEHLGNTPADQQS